MNRRNTYVCEDFVQILEVSMKIISIIVACYEPQGF